MYSTTEVVQVQMVMVWYSGVPHKIRV